MALTLMPWCRTLDREDAGQPGQPGLGCAVVRLTEVSEQAGGGAGVDDAAVALLAHQAKGRLTDVQSSLQMDVDHRVDHGVVHLVERLVPQDAGIVDQHVDPAESVQRGLNDRLPTIRCGYGVVVGYRDATEGGDLVDYPVGCGHRGAAAVESPTQVVHQNLSSTTRKLDRVGAPQATAGSGDDGHTSVKAQISHGLAPLR